MTELVALRTALTRMGFSPAVASFITDTQGMNDLDEFLLLDDEGVGTLCKAIRRPGGQVPNPAFAAAGTAAAAAAAGIPANISNPGYVVSTRTETNLKLMCYFLRYRRSTSRDTEAAVITLDAVRSLKTHKDWEAHHVDVAAPEINDKIGPGPSRPSMNGFVDASWNSPKSHWPTSSGTTRPSPPTLWPRPLGPVGSTR